MVAACRCLVRHGPETRDWKTHLVIDANDDLLVGPLRCIPPCLIGLLLSGEPNLVLLESMAKRWSKLIGVARVLAGDGRRAAELALLHRKTAIAEHTGLLGIHGRDRAIVHLLHVPLLRETLDVEVKRVVDLLVEEYTT